MCFGNLGMQLSGGGAADGDKYTMGSNMQSIATSYRVAQGAVKDLDLKNTGVAPDNFDNLLGEFHKLVARTTMPSILAELGDILVQATRQHMSGLKKALHYLSQVSGGRNSGGNWYDDSKDDIMTHYQATLDVCDHTRISTYTRHVEEASASKWHHFCRLVAH